MSSIMRGGGVYKKLTLNDMGGRGFARKGHHIKGGFGNSDLG